MKSTEQFQKTIKIYLDEMVASDELFAVTYSKPNKNIEDCITYILNAIQKSDCNGFTDNEIFGMAIHYYDEDNIDVGNPVNCHIVVNHTVELTDEEKEEARRNALKRAEDEAYEKIMKIRNRVTTKATPDVQQKTLFDL